MSVSIRRDALSTVTVTNAGHGPFVYPHDLAQRLAEVTGEAKTVRTRLRLMRAVAAALTEGGLHGLRVTDCTTGAGVAHGTFYRYWPDSRAATGEVMEDFMLAIGRRRPRSPSGTPLPDRILLANRYYVEVYRLNAGLMRCLAQLSDAEPAFARIAHEANLRAAARAERAWLRAMPDAAGLSEGERLARLLACIAMVEGLLRDIYLRPPPQPLQAMDAEDLARLLSSCWLRMLRVRE